MSGAATAGVPVAPGLLRVDPLALLGGACATCGALRFPRRPFCAVCQSDAIEERALATTGTVYTFTIVRAAPPGYVGEPPYAIGLVDLPDGLRVTTTLTADDLGELAIGDVVALELLPLGTGEDTLLSFAFRRTGAKAAA